MRRLMDEYGLEGWVFSWMNRKRTLGLCHHRVQCLQLSVSFVELNDEWTVEQVCRHEIAHALAGAGAGHGPMWRAVARQVGVVNPAARCSEAITAPGRYQATCGGCGHVFNMDRRPKNRPGSVRYCPPCYKRTGDIKVAALEYVDTRFNVSVTSTPRTRENAPVSAQQSTPVQTVARAGDDAPKSVTAPQLAAALKVDAKAFRAWLRKYPDIAWEYKTEGGYLFSPDGVRYVARLWLDTH